MTDRCRRPSWFERYLMDAVDVARRHDGVGELAIAAGPALALKDRLRAGGCPATFQHVLIKAAALALREVPELNRLRAGYRLIEPDSIDISTSVALPIDLPFAPLLVIPEADRKGLPEIAGEFGRRLERLPAEIESARRQVDRWGWLLPVAGLRRRAIRRSQRNWRLQRRLCGTFQISNLGATGLDAMHGSIISTSGLLGVGAVSSGPEPRVRCTLHIDHRVCSGLTGARFLAVLARVLADPEALLGAGPTAR